MSVVTSLTFANPWAWLLLALPLLARYGLPALPVRAAVSLPASVWQWFEALTGGRPANTARLGDQNLWLATLAWLALVAALAGPHRMGEPLLRPSGRDLVLAVDLSASMGVVANKSNPRAKAPIDAVRGVLADFVEKRQGDRMALVGFAAEAYLIAPLTYDAGALAAMLAEVSIGLPGRRTDLGRAVGLIVKMLRDQPSAAKVAVLISDGESNAGDLAVADAARLAGRADIVVHAVGFASDIRESNANVLTQIADATGGRYFEARSSEALATVSEEISAIAPAAAAGEDEQRLAESWHWLPLSIGLAALAWLGWREARKP